MINNSRSLVYLHYIYDNINGSIYAFIRRSGQLKKNCRQTGRRVQEPETLLEATVGDKIKRRISLSRRCFSFPEAFTRQYLPYSLHEMHK